MAVVCPRCQRSHPDVAVYCHHDGTMLRQGAAAASGELLHEFVFPGGRRCRTFDDLVQACYIEWDEAKQLLADGAFVGFMSGIGRADLAKLAREGQAQADRDIALTNFITGLPASPGSGPKLNLSPRRLVIGPVRVGEQRPVQVAIQNEGRGLLQGKLTVADEVAWLKFADEEDERTAAIKTARDQTVRFVVNTATLTVGQNYIGKLVAVTNGGVAEVPIRLDLVARPFGKAPYQGASSPQELARKMRDNPKPAVELLENGEIARWFASNGWTYPIVGKPAPGLAAVQQYFEELGLAKAPLIAVSQHEFRLRCTPPERPTVQVTITSAARKLVYGRAESNAPWLKVLSPSVSGQAQAAIDMEIDSTLMDEDKLYLGAVKVTANAGQTFVVKVQVDVQGNRRGWFGTTKPAPPPVPAPAPAPVFTPISAPPPPARPAPAPVPVPPPPAPVLTPVHEPPHLSPVDQGPRFGLGQALLAGAFLGLLWRVLLILPADVYARVLGNAARTPLPGSLEAWLSAPPADEGFLRLFVLATWWVGPLLGALVAWQHGGKATDMICGLIAGAVLGLAGAATVGCVLVGGDEVPRLLLGAIARGGTMAPAVATFLWLFFAIVCWVGLGAVFGVALALGGPIGTGLLAAIGYPFAAVLRLGSVPKAAELFEPRG